MRLILNCLKNLLKLTKSAFTLSEGWINEKIKVPLKSMLKEENITLKPTQILGS